MTRFIEQSGSGAQGPRARRVRGSGSRLDAGSSGARCKRHDKIQCTVTFQKSSKKRGKVRLAGSRRGKRVTALGHATVKAGKGDGDDA